MSGITRRVRRHMLARTGLAWLGMMQIMMFAFPGYVRSSARSSEAQATLEQAIVLMNWISLVLAVPVVLYCAWPVWRGAWRSLRRLKVGMDVPVAVGLVAAFLPSAHSTWTASGEVYFDSVSMFVAFLLTARYLEFCARQTISRAPRGPGVDIRELARSADRIAFWFVLIQLALAGMVGVYWLNIAPDQALGVTVALLVMSCPCAMSMSVPVAVAARRAVQLRRPALDHAELARLDQSMSGIARQNLYGSLAWHLLMAPLVMMGLVMPWLAAVTMLLSSLAVTANAWRLYHQYMVTDSARLRDLAV